MNGYKLCNLYMIKVHQSMHGYKFLFFIMEGIKKPGNHPNLFLHIFM